MSAAYWQSTAQDLAEGLRGLLDAAADAGVTDDAVSEEHDHAERLLAALTYDTAGSASSQNYIDTGVRLLADPPDPEILVGYVDAGDDEEIVVEFPPAYAGLQPTNRYYRDGELVLACPWKGCGSTEFYEVDVAERWNPIVSDDHAVQPDRLTQASRYVDGRPVWEDAGPNPLAGLPIVGVSEGRDGDGYSTSGHLCQGCNRPVSVPDWLETCWG